MNNTGWIDPRIDRIQVEDVRNYLVNHGWHLQPFPGPELLVFGGQQDDDGEPIVLVLPSSERFRDYRLRLESLLSALSVIEARAATAILTDMLRAPSSNGSGGQPAPKESENAIRGV